MVRKSLGELGGGLHFTQHLFLKGIIFVGVGGGLDGSCCFSSQEIYFVS